MTYTYDQIKNAVVEKGYRFFKGNLDINIIGIRNSDNPDSNYFNDTICLLYSENNCSIIKRYKATTDAGLKSRTNPVNSKGCAIVVPGQYISLWTFGLHQGKYEALVQNTPVKVYRDNNKDGKLDFDPKTIEEGYFGINCHRANAKIESTIVDGWSAGCQVISDPDNWNDFYGTVVESSKLYGNKFSYTLLLSSDIRN